MQLQPRLHPLVEHEFYVLVTAPGQRHHERPRLAALVGFVLHGARIAKVDLRLFTRRALHPHRHINRRRFQAMHKPLHRRVGPRKALLLQPRVDGTDPHPFSAQSFDLRPVRFHTRHLTWRRRVRQRRR